MTEKDIIVGLNSITAKYGYGKGTEPFTNDEWNTIFHAKGIIKHLTAENERLGTENAKIDEYRCVITDICEQCEQLKAENDNFTVELEVAQRDVENLTRTLQEANDEIKAVEAENPWKKACELACKYLQFYDYGNEIKEDGIKMKLDYFYQQAKKELREERKDD